jgi:hypothetical protein
MKLPIIYGSRSREHGMGWFRVAGYGLAWKPREAQALFTERYGLIRWFGVFRWRVRVLVPRDLPREAKT